MNLSRSNLSHALAIPCGLALLYASAYFLPMVGPEGPYWLPMAGSQVIIPSLIAVILLIPAMVWLHRRYRDGNRAGPGGIVAVAMLCGIGVLGVFSAAGYSALGILLVVAQSSVSIETTRWLRVSIATAGVAALIALVRAFRPHWTRLFRFLAILGYVYALLAVFRLEHYPRDALSIWRQREPAPAAAPLMSSSTGPAPDTGPRRPKQVFWIIMDELDYDETLGTPGGPQDPHVPNLRLLAAMGVSASAAYSPAKDTVASIPALLTGFPLSGLAFDSDGLNLRTVSAGTRRFQESDSIFGRLPGGARSAAILGYYHPYCWVFHSVDPCVAYPDENVGRWFDALTPFGGQFMGTVRWLPKSGEWLPGGLFEAFAPMYRITEDTLREYPRFLAIGDKSLVFIHVNLPHSPGDFSQRALHYSSVADDRLSYRRNLTLVDRMIGDAMATLRQRSKDRDILLIVSSDHWHRIDSPLAPRPIPWIAWRPGDAGPAVLSQPISTVHTAELILDYLRGAVDDQAQIARWWNSRDFRAPLMPHGQRY